MTTVKEIIEAVKQLDEQGKEEFRDRLTEIDLAAADPFEPFIGSLSAKAEPNWVEKHDEHLGRQALSEGSRDV